MGNKEVLSLLFIIFVILLLLLYWFIPFSTTQFRIETGPSNFSIGEVGGEMQFYPNMRFSTNRISYKIGNCTIQKKDDMIRAFEMLEETTVLDFYGASLDEDITIVCDSKTKIEEGLFIAGEGGPTNISKVGEFSVITHGKILLLRDSFCPTPNVAIHELLHVLGFDHSDNPNNIMYPISNCGQSTGQEIIDTINTIYAVPSYPDLTFENVSALMHGKYLNINMTINNNGFQDSPMTSIAIYGDEKLIKKVDLNPLKIGYGVILSLTNVWVSQISTKELKFVIEGDFDELKKENNKVLLKIKK